MSGAIAPLPQYAFKVWFSVKKKHRDNFTFTLTSYLFNNPLSIRKNSVDSNKKIKLLRMMNWVHLEDVDTAHYVTFLTGYSPSGTQ
jgi:hypothetical protein